MAADSDEEFESFQVTEQDLLNELHPKKRKFTKEDRIYGMWAENDSDDDDRKGAYTQPVRFVSSGTQGGKKDDDNESEEEDLDAEAQRILQGLEEKEVEKEGGKIGIGKFRTAAVEKNRTLGSLHLPKLLQRRKFLLPLLLHLPSPSTTTHHPPPPLCARQMLRWILGSQVDVLIGVLDMGLLRAHCIVSRMGQMGEAHYRLWQQNVEQGESRVGFLYIGYMGYVPGKGLGSAGVGIVNPVKAAKNTEFGDGSVKVGVAMGGSGWVWPWVGQGREASDAAPSGASLFIPEDREDEEEQKKLEEQLQQWRTTDPSKKARPKYVYKTVEELKQSGKKQFGSLAPKIHTSVKVIDMTGPQKRVLSSYEEIHERHTVPDSAFQPEDSKVFLPELLHNITLLVEKTENDILQSDRSLQYNKDLIVNLSHERISLEQDVFSEQVQIEKLSEILQTVEMCENRLAVGPPLNLKECKEILSTMQTKYPAEYKSHALSAIDQEPSKGWDMLTTPYFALDVFQTWREILREAESSHAVPSPDNMDPYDRLVWEIWMPIFRRAVTIWSPRQCDPLINLLESWMPLLPVWVLDNILDQLVMPRLQYEVDVWDPTVDTVPIHAWVHPWLPIMVTLHPISSYTNHITPRYAPPPHVTFHTIFPCPHNVSLQQLLSFNIDSLILQKSVLSPPALPTKSWSRGYMCLTREAMEVFLVRTILPKLAYCLDTLVINPHQQQIASFEWVMAWRDMISIHHYANLLDKHFFPKWLQVLQNWLSSNANFNEVTKWYTGWKGMIDAELLNEPMVKRHFNRALDLMNHAVSGTLQPGMRENVAYFTSTERRPVTQLKASEVTSRTSLQNALTAPMSISFKDVVEKLAEDNGLLFMPIAGQKQYEGKALYSFGKVAVYIDRGVVFAKNVDNIWLPVSLDKLLELAR
eukprot:Em0009g148a